MEESPVRFLSVTAQSLYLYSLLYFHHPSGLYLLLYHWSDLLLYLHLPRSSDNLFYQSQQPCRMHFQEDS